MRIVDLRSDTITKPSPEMWERIKSMDNSKLGDDVFGEDPTVNELERKAAQIMGKEAAVLATSGTQANLVSVLSHTNPGEEILLEELSHMYHNEVGGVARVGGLMIRTYPSNRGVPFIDELQTMIHDRNNIHKSPTTLISAEDTHNYHAGAVIQPEELKKIKIFAENNNLKFHLDGARIFNAAVATKKPVTDFTQHVDSLMFCLSKGLSCPIGSLVAGPKDFISKARKFRKMLGGGMRQAGIIAIFGLAALETKWIQRLAEDHKNAELLANTLESFNLPIEIQKSDTNILIITLPEKSRIIKIITSLNKEGILAFNINDRDIRFVTHYGISEDDIKYSVDKIGKVLIENL